jgi:hypothetical protein
MWIALAHDFLIYATLAFWLLREGNCIAPHRPLGVFGVWWIIETLIPSA